MEEEEPGDEVNDGDDPPDVLLELPTMLDLDVVALDDDDDDDLNRVVDVDPDGGDVLPDDVQFA